MNDNYGAEMERDRQRKSQPDPIWKIIREANDPISLRLSVGGFPNDFGYIVYRGDPQECLKLLREAVVKLEDHLTEKQ